jgi:hypothetical protein
MRSLAQTRPSCPSASYRTVTRLPSVSPMQRVLVGRDLNPSQGSTATREARFPPREAHNAEPRADEAILPIRQLSHGNPAPKRFSDATRTRRQGFEPERVRPPRAKREVPPREAHNAEPRAEQGMVRFRPVRVSQFARMGARYSQTKPPFSRRDGPRP